METEYVDIIADRVISNLTEAHARLSRNISAGEVKELIRLSRFLMQFVEQHGDVCIQMIPENNGQRSEYPPR